MPITIDELNKRFGSTGVSTGTPVSGGRVPTIAELNDYNGKKRKEEEERRRKEEEDRRASEQRQKQAEERVQTQKKEGARKKVEEEVFSRKETIRQATPEEVDRTKGQKDGFWDRVKNFVYENVPFAKDKMKAPEVKGGDTVRQQLVKTEQQREKTREEDIEKLGGNAKTGAESALHFGVPSLFQSTASVIARKAKMEKVAEKLDFKARENRKLKQLFDEEYQELLTNDKYSTHEKMRAEPVRYILALTAEATVTSLPALGAGAAVAYAAPALGVGAAATTTIAALTATGVGSVMTFGGAYQDARDFGLSEEEAEKVGFFTALTTAPLEFIPEFRLLSRLPGGKAASQNIARQYAKNVTEEVLRRTKGAATSAARQGVLESMTEVSQTVVENAWAKTYDENRSYFEGGEQAFLAGFFSGGMLDTLVSMTSSVQSKMRENTNQPPATRGINDMSIEDVTPETIMFQSPELEEEAIVQEARAIADQVAQQAIAAKPAEAAAPAQAFAQQEGETSAAFAERFAKEKPEEFKKSYTDRVKKEFGAANVVSADEAKFAIPGFNATMSAEYHPTASKFSKEYAKELLANKETSNKPVLILAGGSGAGKTSGLQFSIKEFGKNLDDYALAHDTNVSSKEAGMARIDSALETGRRVTFQYTWRDPVEAFRNGVIPRVAKQGRIVPLEAHVENHIGSRQALDELVKEYADNPMVQFRIIDNSNGKNKTKVIQLEELAQMPYNESELKGLLYDELTKAKQAGTISEAEFATFVGLGAQADGGRARASDSGRPEQALGTAGVADEAYKSTVANGGVTINLEGKKPSKGVAYAPFKGTEFAVPEDGFTADIVEEYKTKHLEELSEPGNHLGLWKDGGKVYMDISKVGDPTPETFEEAMSASQLAVFDLEKFETINLGKIENGAYTREYAKATDHPYFNQGKVVPTDLGRAEPEPRQVQASESERAPAKARTGEGITRESGLAKSVKAKAIKARITKAFDGLPEYETVNLAQQAERATELLRTDYARAKSVALGQSEAPTGLRSLSVYKAVEAQALEDRDAITLRDLATYSTVPYELSVAAQEVGLARGRDATSPVDAMRSIVKAREDAAKKTLKGKSVTRVKTKLAGELKKIVRAATPKQDVWVAFVEGLKC